MLYLSRVRQTLKSQSKIGFIGLGNMGMAMMKNLIRSGYNVVVSDKNPKLIEEAQQFGAIPAPTNAEIAQQVSTLFTMVQNYDQLQSVYFGSSGILQNLKYPNSFLIDCSTIGPIAFRAMHEELSLQGHDLIDAPVSGGVPAAKNATITFMVGASHELYEKALPFLKSMGKSCIHCGPPSSGQSVKICNNLILASSMSAVAEGFRLVQALGVDSQTFNNVVNTSSGRCWSSDSYNPVPGIMENVPASKDYQAGFSTNLMIKDILLAVKAAEVLKVAIPLTKKSQTLYSDLMTQGKGQLDFSSIFLHERDVNN